ncbi:cag pathogenicity island protein, partial [Helicobacter pylori]|nr:cag pathogenicity island protein [Helicobacter pylori]NHA90487.1 cag pathogenicity island protein [Helicobacter pylori]
MRKPLSFLGLGELWLIHYFSIEKTTLNPLK